MRVFPSQHLRICKERRIFRWIDLGQLIRSMFQKERPDLGCVSGTDFSASTARTCSRVNGFASGAGAFAGGSASFAAVFFSGF